jgi:hypothetical protein
MATKKIIKKKRKWPQNNNKKEPQNNNKKENGGT